MPTANAVDPAHPAAGASRGSADAWRGLILLCATLAAYWPALLGSYLWDDDAHVTKTAFRSLDGLRRIWFELGATQQYYPLLHSAFWAEAQLWGDNVLGYHLVNVVLHVTAACLVVTLCQRLEIKGAWIAGAVFALHPMNVESVAWISEQKNTLSLVFYLAAAIAYVRFDGARARRDYAIASALFACALMTKTVTASLPAALLVVFWWRRGRIEWRRDVVPLLPWFAAAAASGLFTAWVERHIIGAEGTEYNLDALQRMLLAGRVICFYFGKLLWPSNLIFTYPRWTVDAGQLWQYDYAIGVAAIAFFCWSIRSRTRAPLAGLLVFCGSLFPVLGFLDIYPFRYSYVADHFAYLASLGVIVPVSAGVALAFERMMRRVPPHAAPRTPARTLRFEATALLAPAALLAVLAFLGALTFAQSRMYADAKTLYRTTIERNPDDWMAHQNLGLIYARGAAHRADAIHEFQEVVRLKPDHARAHYSLGVALYLSGRGGEAVEHFEKAIEFAPDNALIAGTSHYFLGVILTPMPGRLDDAIAHLEAALKMRPDDPESRAALGAAESERARALPRKRPESGR